MNNVELDILRNKIDDIDSNLCQLIKERQSLAKEIMNAKKGNFPFDPSREEANKLNIPVIAIVDSNNSFEGVDYMIPGNDDSMSSIELFVKEITNIIVNTKSKFVKTASTKEERPKSDSSVTKTKSLKKKQVIDTKTIDDNKEG